MKKLINKIIVLSFKNHWLILLILASFMYLSGEIMSKPGKFAFLLPFNLYYLIIELHGLFGKLILISAIVLSVQKIYLILSKKIKI